MRAGNQIALFLGKASLHREQSGHLELPQKHFPLSEPFNCINHAGYLENKQLWETGFFRITGWLTKKSTGLN